MQDLVSISSRAKIMFLGRVFVLGLILSAMAVAPVSWQGESTIAPTSVVAQTLTPGPWVELEMPASAGLSAKPATQTQWEQRFERVTDTLEIRVGSAKGTLISWSDRGENGRYTWTQADGAGTKDITRWVGNGAQIKLWARVWSRNNQRAYCAMDTLYNSNRRQRWELSDTAEYTIGQ